MPYDPATFKNLCPFPDTRKIKEGIEQNILSIELEKPYSINGVKIGKKVTISRYFE